MQSANRLPEEFKRLARTSAQRLSVLAGQAKAFPRRSVLENLEPLLWSLPECVLEKLLDFEDSRPEMNAAERRRTEILRRALGSRSGREGCWRAWCRRLRQCGALKDGGPQAFFALWEALPPDRLALPEDEEEARRRAEAAYVMHLRAIACGKTGLSIAEWRRPLPSEPDRQASDEAVLRMLWLWAGYVTYCEPLSAAASEAVRRLLKRAWPTRPVGHITRSVIERWVRYAQNIRYERDAEGCYGGRGWDPSRGL